MSISDKLTKSNVSMIVGAVAVFFSIYLFVDTTYFRASAAEKMEVQIAQALNEQMKMQQKFYVDQQTINDMRQLDQLRCSKALLEVELNRNPNDRLIKEKLDIINTQIKTLEDKVYK